jgi:tRNA dimethylallyltransferase
MTDFPGNKTLVVIVGPTAVGKTALAIRIASHFNTEIMSADSRQFFRELNIGTAKPSDLELKSVVHHFINNLSVEQDYDAAQYGVDALALIHQLFQRFDVIVVCGGSGLYLKGLLEGFDDIPEVSKDVRDSIIREYESHGIAWLQDQMKKLDPEHYNGLDKQNPHRLIRALEVKMGTGQSISDFRRNKKVEHSFNVIKIGLELPREELYDRIDRRMDSMIEQGLFDEAKSVYPFKDHNALQTVGYQEIFDYVDGLYDKEEAIRLLKRNSRRYAKRQLTWFKRDPQISWFKPDQYDAILDHINSYLHQQSNNV